MPDGYNELAAALLGEDAYTTADILDRMPKREAPGFWERYIKPLGSASLAKREPNWLGKNVLANPALQDALLAVNFLSPAMKVPRIPSPIKAYHGSPHDYAAERLVQRPDGSTEYLVGLPDKLPDVPAGYQLLHDFPLGRPRLDRIGTGEGAQAYGHGWYAAEREGVARSYRDNLARASQDAPYRLLDNVALSRPKDPAGAHAFDMLKGHEGNVDAAIAAIAKNDPNPERRTAAIANLQRWKENGVRKYEPEGKMYEANLHATPEQFLDWDKPLAGQSQNAAAALRRSEYFRDHAPAMPLGDAMTNVTQGGWSGRPIHQNAITQELREAGIPGIKYLDQGSRGAGGGTSNYVVWSPEIIEILRKYGIAAPIAGASLADLLSQPSPQQ